MADRPDRPAIAELHIHVEGSLEPDMVLRLAGRNQVEIPWRTTEELSRVRRFTDLSSFLELYYHCTSVLRNAEDFYELADAYLARAAADGVVRAEMFFDPQAHTTRGVGLAEVVDGLSAAVRSAPQRHGVTVGLIACFLRDKGPDDAMRTLESLAPFRDEIIGVGLDSAEIGNPPSLFAAVFEAAAGEDLHRVAHAGEEGPADYIWEAIDILGVERIDHGIRCLDDPVLVRRLVEDNIPLTVCPLSNVSLGCVPNIEAHPLARMMAAGLHVTINSDDPAYFGGYVYDNYRAAAEALALSTTDIAALADASLAAAFDDSSRSKP